MGNRGGRLLGAWDASVRALHGADPAARRRAGGGRLAPPNPSPLACDPAGQGPRPRRPSGPGRPQHLDSRLRLVRVHLRQPCPRRAAPRPDPRVPPGRRLHRLPAEGHRPRPQQSTGGVGPACHPRCAPPGVRGGFQIGASLQKNPRLPCRPGLARDRRLLRARRVGGELTLLRADRAKAGDRPRGGAVEGRCASPRVPAAPRPSRPRPPVPCRRPPSRPRGGARRAEWSG